MSAQTPEPQEERTSVVRWSALAIALMGTLAIGMMAFAVAFGPEGPRPEVWQDVMRTHFATVIGLPAAALLSFILVMFLRQTAGPIEINLPGVKIKGAAGQLVMWVACYMAVATAIKMLW